MEMNVIDRNRPAEPQMYNSFNRAEYYLSYEPECFYYHGDQVWGRLPAISELRATATFGIAHFPSSKGRRFELYDKRIVTEMHGEPGEYDLVEIFDTHAEAAIAFAAKIAQYCESKIPAEHGNEFKWL